MTLTSGPAERERSVYLCCTDLNVLTRLFRSVETSLMLRRRGPMMFLRLHDTETKDEGQRDKHNTIISVKSFVLSRGAKMV